MPYEDSEELQPLAGGGAGLLLRSNRGSIHEHERFSSRTRKPATKDAQSWRIPLRWAAHGLAFGAYLAVALVIILASDRETVPVYRTTLHWGQAGTSDTGPTYRLLSVGLNMKLLLFFAAMFSALAHLIYGIGHTYFYDQQIEAKHTTFRYLEVVLTQGLVLLGLSYYIGISEPLTMVLLISLFLLHTCLVWITDMDASSTSGKNKPSPNLWPLYIFSWIPLILLVTLLSARFSAGDSGTSAPSWVTAIFWIAMVGLLGQPLVHAVQHVKQQRWFEAGEIWLQIWGFCWKYTILWLVFAEALD